MAELVERVVTPSQVGRGRWERDETARDVRVLEWVGRFRFVTCELLDVWLGVSVQQAGARVRRLKRAGMLRCWRPRSGDRRLVYLSDAGTRLLGLPRRTAPRLDLQREHELAIIGLDRMLTERECRRLERARDGSFSVEVPRSQRNEARRWPDLVVEDHMGLTAIEIELSPKTSDRLSRMLSGYGATHYAAVIFYTATGALGRRIEA